MSTSGVKEALESFFSPDNKSILTLISLFIPSTGSCLNILMTTLYPDTMLAPRNTREDEPFPSELSIS